MVRHPNLLLIGALATLLLTTLPPSAHGLQQRDLSALGKWKDGPPTEIDCSASSSDYEYYIERCLDETTMWWINGHCINGQKEEVSEYHRCMKPDGSRPYCHDCNDGSGNIKNVCGSDNPEKEEVCEIAWASTAENCGDQGLTVYSHQCVAPSGGSDHWYLRESMYCDEGEVYPTGPNMEDVPATFTCGQEWYYAYEPGDEGLIAINPDLAEEEHPFVSGDNMFCLDCGMAIQVCAGEGDATCEDLGLPPKGEEAVAVVEVVVEEETTTTVAPPTEPVSTDAPEEYTTTEATGPEVTATDAPDSTDPTEPAATEPAATEPAATDEPAETEPSTTPSPTTPSPTTTLEPTDAKAGDDNVGEVDGAQAAPSSAYRRSYRLVVVVGAIAGWTLTVFMM